MNDAGRLKLLSRAAQQRGAGPTADVLGMAGGLVDGRPGRRPRRSSRCGSPPRGRQARERRDRQRGRRAEGRTQRGRWRDRSARRVLRRAFVRPGARLMPSSHASCGPRDRRPATWRGRRQGRRYDGSTARASCARCRAAAHPEQVKRRMLGKDNPNLGAARRPPSSRSMYAGGRRVIVDAAIRPSPLPYAPAPPVLGSSPPTTALHSPEPYRSQYVGALNQDSDRSGRSDPATPNPPWPCTWSASMADLTCLEFAPRRREREADFSVRQWHGSRPRARRSP